MVGGLFSGEEEGALWGFFVSGGEGLGKLVIKFVGKFSYIRSSCRFVQK